jgi:ATP-dependent DNA ligase
LPPGAVALQDRAKWEALVNADTVKAYPAFDVLWLNGRDLRNLPLTKRKLALSA